MAQTSGVAQTPATYAADAPEVLRKDFRNSPYAVFEPNEVVAQLKEAGL